MDKIKETCGHVCGRGKSCHGMGCGLWLIGWLFTVGFLQLGFWKGFLALILWPYYLGVVYSLFAPLLK